MNSRNSVFGVPGQLLASLMALCVSCPVTAVVPESASIAVLRGRGADGVSSRNYDLLQRRIQRWLEDSSSGKLQFRSVDGTENEVHSQLELERWQLQTAAEDLLTGRHADEALAATVSRLLERLKTVFAFGPQLQLAYVALGVAALRSSHRVEAIRYFGQARSLHPSGRLAAVLPWQWDGLERREVEALWSELPQPTQSCEVHLEDFRFGRSLEAVPLRVNGFAMSGAVRVPPGLPFFYSLESATAMEEGSVFACSGPGSQRVQLGLGNLLAFGWDQARVAALARISQRHDVATLLVVDRADDQFRLYLYTPGFGVDAVPTSGPLRSHDLQQNSLPIQWDSFQALLRRHQTRVAQLDLGAREIDTSPAAAIEQAILEKAPWYRRPSTWVVVGAVVTGVAVAIFATRSHSSVQSGGQGVSAASSGAGLAIRFP